MNSTTAQTIRTERARTERPNYECRTSYIGGSLSVFVVNTVNQVVYTVRAGRCNCEDFIRRCDGRGLKCKHILLAEEHLGLNEAEPLESAEPSLPVMSPERYAQAVADRALWD